MENLVDKLNILSQILSKSKKVNSFDSPEEKGSNLISYSLLEINESSTEILKLIENLQNNNLEDNAIEDILHDIGEELRHILYHIYDSKFYDYIYIEKEK